MQQIIAEQAPQRQLPLAKHSPHCSAELDLEIPQTPEPQPRPEAGQLDMLLNPSEHRQPPWRRARATSWIYSLAVLLLVWLYVYFWRFGYLRTTSSTTVGPQLQASVPGYNNGDHHPGSLGNGDDSDHDDVPIDNVPIDTVVGVDPTKTSTTTPVLLIDIVTSFATATPSIKTIMTNKTKNPAGGQGAAANGPLATAPAATINQGTYIGVTVQKSKRFPKAFEAFRGVPYARDTSGQNRFHPPQRLPASTKTINAARWGQACPTDGVVRPGMGENCLNLNVYRPAGLIGQNGYLKYNTAKKAKLPVIVYVHGGGFNAGRGIERNMASFVSWADDAIVSVNFNYRIGALGFLPSDVTARAGLLNLGLRDQQMALEWVKENIDAFGGDPDNITVMGLSAGAHSVSRLLTFIKEM